MLTVEGNAGTVASGLFEKSVQDDSSSGKVVTGSESWVYA